MLKIYARQGTTADNVHEIISFTQSNCLENIISSATRKRNEATNGFEKKFYELKKTHFMGKHWKTKENDYKEVSKKYVDIKNIKEQSKLTSNEIHQFYTIFDSYTFKQHEVLMDNPIYIGFAVLEMTEFLMFET